MSEDTVPTRAADKSHTELLQLSPYIGVGKRFTEIDVAVSYWLTKTARGNRVGRWLNGGKFSNQTCWITSVLQFSKG